MQVATRVAVKVVGRDVPHPKPTLAMTPGVALTFGLPSFGEERVVTEFVRAGVTFMVSLMAEERRKSACTDQGTL